MATDLPCGCRIGPPRDRLCQYHEGADDERVQIVAWLHEHGYSMAADRIDDREHLPRNGRGRSLTDSGGD